MRLGGALLLGLLVTGAALAFGSRALGVAGVGLMLAALVTRIWARWCEVPSSSVIRSLPLRQPRASASSSRSQSRAPRGSRWARSSHAALSDGSATTSAVCKDIAVRLQDVSPSGAFPEASSESRTPSS